MVIDTVTLIVDSGWNLISLPVDPLDKEATTLFPSAVSGAFAYNGTYQKVDSMLPAIGYWMKFGAPETTSIIGYHVTSLTLQLRKGWNLIGSPSSGVAQSLLDVTPCDADLTSAFFTYSTSLGYIQSDTILPGQGAWMKVSDDGLLFEKRWEKITDIPFETLSPHPTQPDVLIAGIPSDFSENTVGALMKSTDGGTSWDTVLSGVDAIGKIYFDPSDPSVVYAGLGSVNTCAAGIVKSTDAGETWFRADSGIVENLDCYSWAFVDAIDPQNTDVLYATGGGIDIFNRLYKSVDGGTSWVQLQIPRAIHCVLDTNFLNLNILTLALDPQNPDVIFGGTQLDSILYWSTNGGDDWNVRHCFEDRDILSVHVDSTDSNRIFVGNSGFFRSMDGGVSWQVFNDGLANVELGIGFEPTKDPDLLYAQTSGCFFRTENAGTTWTEVLCDANIVVWEALDKVGGFLYVSDPDGVYRMRVCLPPTE